MTVPFVVHTGGVVVVVVVRAVVVVVGAGPTPHPRRHALLLMW